MSVAVSTATQVLPHEAKTTHALRPISLDAAIRAWKIPESIWIPQCQPRVDEVVKEVDGYFLEHWNFTGERERNVFVAAGFSRVTSLYFPMAKDDRIHFACRLLTVLFLIDDELEDMSFEDGAAYNERLITLSRGEGQPDRKFFTVLSFLQALCLEFPYTNLCNVQGLSRLNSSSSTCGSPCVLSTKSSPTRSLNLHSLS